MRLWPESADVHAPASQIRRFLVAAAAAAAVVALWAPAPARAANCGGVTPCTCGDTVTSSYTLTSDLSCPGSVTALTVGAHDVVIDGGDRGDGSPYVLSGTSGGTGISDTSGGYRVTVRKMSIQGFGTGIRLQSITGPVNVSSTAFTSNGTALRLQAVTSATIEDNTFTSSTSIGLQLFIGSNSNTVRNNAFTGNVTGLSLTNASGNTFTSNTFTGNTTGISFGSNFNNTFATSNTIEGKAVYYLYGQNGSQGSPLVYDGNSIPGGVALFWAINSSYVELRNVSISLGTTCVYFNNVATSTVQNVTTSGCATGIELANGSRGNTLTGNTASGHTAYGIYLNNAPSSTLSGNVLSGNASNLHVATALGQTIGTTNTVEGKPVYYLYGVYGSSGTPVVYDGDELAGGVGMFWAVNSNYVTLRDATLSRNNVYGVYMSGVNTSTVQSVSSSGSGTNVLLAGSTYITVQGGTFGSSTNGSVGAGIYVSGCSYCTFSGNRLYRNAKDGIYIASGSVGNQITGNYAFDNYNSTSYLQPGIRVDGTGNTVSGNYVYNNAGSGIRIAAGSNVVSGNYLYYNPIGLELTGGSGSTISGNEIRSNRWGVSASAGGNTFSGNTVLDNVADVADVTANTYSGNSFIHNSSSTLIRVAAADRDVELGSAASVTVTMHGVNGTACPSCSYVASVSPTEDVTVNPTSNSLAISFTPSRLGFYSLTVSTTASGNSAARRISFLVSPAGEAASTTVTRYYLRGDRDMNGQERSIASRGQPKPVGTKFNDGHTLMLTAPTSLEEVTCGGWAQNSPDELPPYGSTAAVLRGATFSYWYQNDADGGFGILIGLERRANYQNTTDVSQSIAAASAETLGSWTLSGIDWEMDYPHDWYWTSAKMVGANPRPFTEPGRISYVDLTSSFSPYPAIRSLGNEKVLVLSATRAGDGSYQVVLENPAYAATTTPISFGVGRRAFLSYTSSIGADGATTVTSTSVGTAATTSMSFTAVPLAITPASGSVDVQVASWNSGTTYYRSWTETTSDASLSTAHTVGDLEPGVRYLVTYARSGGGSATQGTYTADAAGEISFTYSGGYSTVTFEVERVSPAADPGSGGGAPLPLPSQPGQTLTPVWQPPLPLPTPTPGGSDAPTSPGSGSPRLIKAPGSPDVYVVTDTGFRRRIPNEAAFLSYGYRWQDVATVTDAALAAHPRTALIKSAASPRVYRAADGVRRWIPDEATFLGRRYTWNAVSTVSPEEMAAYVDGPDLTVQDPPLQPQPSAAPRPVGTIRSFLQVGSSGAEVRLLQALLRYAGFFDYPADTGTFGAVTRDAVARFQRSHGLAAVGYVGPATRAALNALP